MANQKKHRWLPYLMVLPAFSIMVLVVVFPIVNTVARSFRTTDGRFTLDNYAYFFTSAEALQSLLFTLAEALTVMALSVVLSFLLALYLRFSKSPVSRALGKLYLLPRFIPGIAAVYAVMNVIKDSGSINRIAAAFGVDLALPPFRTTTLTIHPDRPGEYGFACGMNMLLSMLQVLIRMNG